MVAAVSPAFGQLFEGLGSSQHAESSIYAHRPTKRRRQDGGQTASSQQASAAAEAPATSHSTGETDAIALGVPAPGLPSCVPGDLYAQDDVTYEDLDPASIPPLDSSDATDIDRVTADLGSLASLSLSNEADDTTPYVSSGNHVLGDDDMDREIEETEETPRLCIKQLKVAQAFIDALKDASLEDEDLHPDVLSQLKNPPTQSIDLDDPALRLSLDVYLGMDRASEKVYNHFRGALLRSHKIEMLSLDRVKRVVQEISGIRPLYRDMCWNSCVGFVGPFENLDRCPECGEPRYEVKKDRPVPRKRFLTNIVGPIIQSTFRSPRTAHAMRYRQKCTEAILEEALANGNKVVIDVLSDYLHGSAYFDAIKRGHITKSTVILVLSLDGVQLYHNKTSDCWIYIWINYNLAPEQRYKKENVFIGGVIPGPLKPKIIESFLFPGMHHLAALMREGLPVWDASSNIITVSDPYLIFLTADGPGMATMNGFVGHTGAVHCRQGCGMKGRNRPGLGIYYPAVLKPDDPICRHQHDDIDLWEFSTRDPRELIEKYKTNLRRVLESPNITEFNARRLATGIARPSIVSGLPSNRVFPLPSCFPSDAMHLAAINIPDLIISLWRASITCGTGDNRDTWDWAVLRNHDVWHAHGAEVAAATPYLPTSFDRPPRNPAEKISSGYKAIELLTYLYVLGPGIFYGLLPDKYWTHFCKLVRGLRITHQRRVTKKELKEAHTMLIEFCNEFETLYYQRKLSRMHFVRPCVHACIHIAPMSTYTGPYGIYTQWTLEREIGDIGAEIRQPSNPFANLCNRALRRCQVNAVKAIIPELNPVPVLPRGAHDLHDNYILLRATEQYPHHVLPAEKRALLEFLHTTETDVGLNAAWLDSPKVARWARVRLPNGQIARSLWREGLKRIDQVRMSRNVKLAIDGKPQYAEVRYYFKMQLQATEPERGLAMVSFYKDPDQELLRRSHNTLWSCHPGDDHDLHVIDIKSIQSVVAVIPHPKVADPVLCRELEGRVYIGEKHQGKGVSAIYTYVSLI